MSFVVSASTGEELEEKTGFFMKEARIPRSVNGDEWRFSFLTAFKKVAGFP
jgi:hypothetical protein